MASGSAPPIWLQSAIEEFHARDKEGKGVGGPLVGGAVTGAVVDAVSAVSGATISAVGSVGSAVGLTPTKTAAGGASPRSLFSVFP